METVWLRLRSHLNRLLRAHRSGGESECGDERDGDGARESGGEKTTTVEGHDVDHPFFEVCCGHAGEGGGAEGDGGAADLRQRAGVRLGVAAGQRDLVARFLAAA